MHSRIRLSISLLLTACWFGVALSPSLRAQQTLGGITGTVTDPSGAVLPDTVVTLVGDETKYTRVLKTNNAGLYDFVNLPIGTYTLTFSHDGFETFRVPTIAVQADRTATVNATLKIGAVGTTVTVTETPLMNAVDTTNGYVLDKSQIEDVPLPTGSFTGLAILSPGVNAELSGGTGANSGLGNQPIWANGQRDTSNTFLLNGVDASNLFNGKSTSQVASARIVNNTGINSASSTSTTALQTTASVYLAIGQALPTPAPETIEEVRVNTSMYDAQQGSTSGAHIDMSTSSGTNNYHGMAYVHRGTNELNAAPFFDNANPNIPESEKVPELHRYSLGGAGGGALVKDKLFFYLAYQQTQASDQEIGISRLAVPFGLTDDNRTAAGLAAIANTNFGTSLTAANIDPIALALFQYQLPNGQYLIPSATPGVTPSNASPTNAAITNTAYFNAYQQVSNLDWTASPKDTLSIKYYYQHDPSIAPYGYSSVSGFTQYLDAGSQVISFTNSQILKPNLSVAEVFGFLREKAYSTNRQLFSPQSLGINTFGSSYFPGISIVDILGDDSPNNVGTTADPGPVIDQSLNIGAGAASQGAFTGMFQNRWMPSANAIWTLGKHTVTFGGAFSYTQLNTRDDRTGKGMIASADFSQFVQGLVTTNDDFQTTSFLQGDANRYYRSNETGEYLQDKYQVKPSLSLTLGVRFDWNGGLSEK
ncbi:MAG: carboxypeptidase-like regulatory domain-containing protein, partial [Candidatus Acidiferrales bacterium]